MQKRMRKARQYKILTGALPNTLFYFQIRRYKCKGLNHFSDDFYTLEHVWIIFIPSGIMRVKMNRNQNCTAQVGL